MSKCFTFPMRLSADDTVSDFFSAWLKGEMSNSTTNNSNLLQPNIVWKALNNIVALLWLAEMDVSAILCLLSSLLDPPPTLSK